ncbi:YraN family protein [Altererythrobacter sp. HHU K3-1]|uniref:YraN family protein n=2 Tax=Qipengyuania atrilutea TaxID=2744473 RepID=A0A850GW87_9SPHN|nr:YraN family protein [Actirhodobacter atriluteus]
MRGREAEELAADWYAARGWNIVASRVKTKLGEIDLIVQRPGITVFAEVKWRRSADALNLAIDERRLARVAAAVEAVAHEYAEPNDDIRIDVLLLAPGLDPRHIPNAWQP